MIKLKDITTLKKGTSPKEKETNLPDEKDIKQTYYQAGLKDSTIHFGDKISLNICLQAIHAKFQNEEKKEKSEKETLIKTTTVVLDNLREKNETRKEKIEDLENEIIDIPNNPKKYGIDVEKGSSAKFWIGIFLVIPIALYLFIFYISTSYSAFFRQFKLGEDFNPFDPKALEKSWQHGALQGIFVTFIPFVFLGLGYLIHMFGESKKVVDYFKIAFLFIITFVFDAILVYQIEDKLYKIDINRRLGDPPFNINIAFQKVEFWGIIFLGFVTYIIFGLVLDFVMKEHKERDKIRMAIGGLKSKINIEEKKIDDTKDEIHILKEKIEGYEELIGATPKVYKLYASEYTKGWLASIHQIKTITKAQTNLLIDDCKDVYCQHIKDVGMQ